MIPLHTLSHWAGVECTCVRIQNRQQMQELTTQASPSRVNPLSAPGQPKGATSCGVTSIPATVPRLKVACTSVSARAL